MRVVLDNLEQGLATIRRDELTLSQMPRKLVREDRHFTLNYEPLLAPAALSESVA